MVYLCAYFLKHILIALFKELIQLIYRTNLNNWYKVLGV